MQADLLEALVAQVISKTDYRSISPNLVWWIGREELSKRKNIKEAARHTRSRLHQVAGAYQDPHKHYPLLTKELDSLPPDRFHPAIQEFCRGVMNLHASSRERLPILDSFFSSILSRIGPIHSILDIGCGLNPLALPWMPLIDPISYFGLDIYFDQAAFLNAFLSHVGVGGEIKVHNLVNGLPPGLPHIELAFILKTLPCLEQLDKDITGRLLKDLNVDWLVVSYPIYSLGGRSKGMLQNYEKHFMEISQEYGWQQQRFAFQTELAFLARMKP